MKFILAGSIWLLLGFVACEPSSIGNPHLRFSPAVAPYCAALMNASPPAADPRTLASELGLPKGSFAYDAPDPRYQRIAFVLGEIDGALYGPKNAPGGTCQDAEQLWSNPQSVQEVARFFNSHPLQWSATDALKFHDDSFRQLDELASDYVSMTAILNERSLGLPEACPGGLYVLPIIGVNVFSPEETKQKFTDLQTELYGCTRTWPSDLRDLPWRYRTSRGRSGEARAGAQ